MGDSLGPNSPPSNPTGINNRTTPASADAETQTQQPAIPSLYCPLLPRPDSIRLLRLLPSEDKNEVIQCQLFNCSLQESNERTHPYEALSYVWGKSNQPCPIIHIEKHDLPVTPNLHEALLRLRHRYIERIIWVDAVCINQGNLEEKQQQIQFMAKIYSQANRVVVWLGETADNSEQALEEIHNLAGGKVSTNSLNKETIQEAILALLQRPWFRRIWVREWTLNDIYRNY